MHCMERREISKLYFIDNFYIAYPLTSFSLQYKIWDFIELCFISYLTSLGHNSLKKSFGNDKNSGMQ